MALSLKTVEPARGVRWITDAARLFMRRPLGFAGLLALWIVGGMLLSSLLPGLGSVITLMSPPLVSLGFMIAGQSVLLDGPVHPRQFIEPLLTDKRRRNALLLLCGLYGAAVILTLLVTLQLADETLNRLAQQKAGQAIPMEEMLALLTASDLTTASVFFTVAMSAISAPFWHAAALIHWGGQSAAQSLFSSLLAVWRNKLAFAVYFLTLTALGSVGLFAIVLVFGTFLPLQLVVLLLSLAWTVIGAVFYLSVLFTFNDSFGGSPVMTDEGPATQPDL
jgi:hypothetical protein